MVASRWIAWGTASRSHGTPRQRVGDEEFELAGFVAAARQPEQVVALDPQVAPRFARKLRHRLERRMVRRVAAAGEAGEVHGRLVAALAG